MTHSVTHGGLVGTTEAAELLGVSVRTVHRLVSAQRLTPAAKLAGLRGAYLFDKAQVAALKAVQS